MRDAPGLVVDLRHNDGGMDMAAANIAGMFGRSTFFYETITFLHNRTLEQEVIADLWVEPQEVYWGRPTAVLIDGDTVSSGEGLAFLMSKQPQVQLFGFEGTAASLAPPATGSRSPVGGRSRSPRAARSTRTGTSSSTATARSRGASTPPAGSRGRRRTAYGTTPARTWCWRPPLPGSRR